MKVMYFVRLDSNRVLTGCRYPQPIWKTCKTCGHTEGKEAPDFTEADVKENESLAAPRCIDMFGEGPPYLFDNEGAVTHVAAMCNGRVVSIRVKEKGKDK
jgi:hypothetical protein